MNISKSFSVAAAQLYKRLTGLISAYSVSNLQIHGALLHAAKNRSIENKWKTLHAGSGINKLLFTSMQYLVSTSCPLRTTLINEYRTLLLFSPMHSFACCFSKVQLVRQAVSHVRTKSLVAARSIFTYSIPS